MIMPLLDIIVYADNFFLKIPTDDDPCKGCYWNNNGNCGINGKYEEAVFNCSVVGQMQNYTFKKINPQHLLNTFIKFNYGDKNQTRISLQKGLKKYEEMYKKTWAVNNRIKIYKKLLSLLGCIK